MAARSARGRSPLHSLLRSRRDMLGAALARLDVRRGIVVTLTLITILMGPRGFLTNLPVVYAQGSQGAPSNGSPNRFNPSQDVQSITHSPQSGKSDPNWKPTSPQPIVRPFLPSMQAGSLTLTSGKAATFIGSDGRLEVDVPANAITASDLSQAGGKLTLQITQIAAPAGSSAGGWGLISLGSYLFQVIDAHGKQATHGLRAPVTLKLHYGTREGAFDLTRAFVVLNGGLPQGTRVATPAGSTKPTFGAGTSLPTTLDSAQRTLSVSPSLSPSTSASWDTFSPVSTFGKPDPFNVDLNAGALTMGYPINLPAGPGGLTPPLQLSYSSAGVSEQHSPQGAAPWVGEGWSLGLGSISWAEFNATSSGGTATWEDTWNLNDPFGTSAQLIPPAINVTTYYDDTPNAITPSPVAWHTSPETHAKIYSYVGPNHLIAGTPNIEPFASFF